MERVALWNRIAGWSRNERGASMVEYGFLLVLIMVVILAGVTSLGQGVNNRMSNVSSHVSGTP